MTIGKTLLTFLGGAAAGAIAGVLLAPKSGKETRELISQKASDLTDEIGSTLESNGQRIKTLANSVISEVNKKVAELL